MSSKRVKSRTEYTIINMIAGFGGYFLNTILGFVCRMVFARCLPGEYLGINGLFTNILTMLSLAELGIGAAIGYALYKPIAEKDEEKIASLMQLYGKAYRAIGFAVAAVGLAVLPFLQFIIGEAPAIKESITLIYGIYLFNTASAYFFSYRITLITASQRNYIVLSVNYIATIVQSAVQIVFLLLTKEYLPYLLIQTVCTFATNIILSQWAKKDYPYITKKDVKPISKEERKSLFINVKALTVNKLCSALVNSTDNIVITYLNGLITTGLASNYILLTSTLEALVKQFFNGFTASIGNLNASESKEKKYNFFKVLNLLNFWIYSWSAIGVAFVSGDIVRLCFGETYVLDMSVPLAIAVNLYLTGMNQAPWTYKSTMGLFKYGQYLLILTAGINLTLDFVLGKQFGLLGIYVATIIARLLTNVWYEPYAVFKHGLGISPWQYFKKYLIYALILVVTGVACWYLCSLCTFSVVVNLILKVLICSIIPNGVFIICFCRSEEFKYLFTKVKKISKKLVRR